VCCSARELPQRRPREVVGTVGVEGGVHVGRTSILVSWIERGRGIVSLGALGDCNWIQLSSACRWKPVEFLRFGGLFAEQDG
jgi:hypothetical protein